MSKKRIAVVCDYVLKPSRIGGMDRFFVAYDAKVKLLGYEVDWYFSDYEDFDFYLELKIYRSKQRNLESFFLEEVKKSNKEYEFLITHFLALCTPFYKSAKTLRINKIIAVDHNPRPLEGFPFVKAIKNIIKGILFGKYIDLFVGVSRYTKSQILKDYGFFLGKKTKVIHNGIDTKVFAKRLQVNRNKFVVCSHLRYSKGIQDLIKAIAILEENVKSQIQIDVFGEGPYESELIEMTKANHLTNIIHFLGGTSNLNKLLQNYSYLVQPTYMECFSLSILESLAANVPVITTNVGGNIEVIDHGRNGFIFQPKDFLALSELLKNIVNGDLQISNNVSEQIENNFNLEKMVSNHLDLLCK